MADEVARLVAVMEAQLRGFTKGMEQAQAIADQKFGQIERRMNQTEKRFSTSFRDLGSLATRIGGALGIAFSVEGLINFGKQVLVSTAQLSEQAQQAQVGVEALQAYRIAFKEAGSSAETADRALGLLNKTLGEAQQGSTSAREEFQRLHLSFQDVANAKPDERLALVSKALLEMKNGANRAALETQFFGRSGREIESVLTKLAGGVHALTDEYKDQGRIITDELAKKTDDALDRMSAAWDRTKTASVPAIAAIAEAVANLLSNIAGLPASVDQLKSSLIAAQSVANRNRGTAAGRSAQARVDDLSGQILKQHLETLPFLAPESFQPKLGIDESSIGALDKFFAKMQLIASLAGEVPDERAKDEKLIEAATAKLEEEGRSNLVLLKSMKDVNDVLNEQKGLREKILKIIEDENAAAARSAFTERLKNASLFQQAGATTIKAPEIPKVKADEEQFKRVSEEFGTDAATALDRRLHGDQATVPDVTITPRNANTPTGAPVIPVLDQQAKEHADQITQDALNALEERSRKLSRIENAETTIIDELKEEARIAGELPRKREEEIELLRIKQSFGADFEKQHEEEVRALIRSKQAAEDYVAIQETAIDGLAEIGASALTGSRNVQEAFAQMLASLAQYIIKLELAKALEASLGTGTGGGSGFLSFLGSLIGLSSGDPFAALIPAAVNITPRVRASGGPVKKDEPYIVGEQGKELFVPDISGFIIPNKKTEEILRTQDARAFGGPVSQGKPYIVGETGRELFVPSISGFVYPQSPDDKHGIRREAGRPVAAGQPIVVGDVGVEVFVPDFPDAAQPNVNVAAPSIATTNQQSDNRQTETNTATTHVSDVRQQELFARDVAEPIQPLQSPLSATTQAPSLYGRRPGPRPDMRSQERTDEPFPQSAQRSHISTVSHTYIIGEHGQELFIPNVAGFIYPKAVPEKGRRDIAKVLAAGQPIIVGQRGEEIFAPYISDVRHEARVNRLGDATHTSSTSDNRSVSQDVNESHRISNDAHPQYQTASTSTSDETNIDLHRSTAHTQADNRRSSVTHGDRSISHAMSEPTFDIHAQEARHEQSRYPETTINLRREAAPQRPGRLETQKTHSVRADAITAYSADHLVERNNVINESQSVSHANILPAQATAIREPISGQSTPEHPTIAIQPHHASPRASGGPVSPGYMYIVGEHGREMFTPSSMGNHGPEVKSFAFGGILGGLLGDFGGTSLGAFGLLKLLGLDGGGALGLASKAGIPNSFDLLDWLKNHFAEGGVMGPEGKIPLQKFGFGGIFGGLLGDFGGQSSNLGAFGVLKMFGLGGGSSLAGYSQSQGLGAFGLIDWLKDRFAEGGIMGPHGRIPIHSFASGGIANSPQLAMFGEGSGPEAFVPLQGGKIPVRLQIPQISVPVSSGGSSSNSIYVDARGAQVGVAEQIQQALTRAFPTFVGAAVSTVDKNFPSMFRRAHRDRL